MAIFVSYCRVSTQRQGASGLGLEAQQQAVAQHVAKAHGELVGLYVEIESGASKRRPQLVRALSHCRKAKAVLLIAKLDRLARNVAFIATLMEAGIEFVAVDAPYANRLMLHILAAFAEHERDQISARTKAALAAAKTRGVRLGVNGAQLAADNRREALAHARMVAPALSRARQHGCTTLTSLASFLNQAAVPTASGGQWHPATVARVQARLDAINCNSTGGCI